MSIQTLTRKSGRVYKVAWRDELGKQRSRSFSLKADAETWEAKIKLAKRQGELAELDAGRQTLSEFMADWWRLHATLTLAPKTLEIYAGLKDRHIEPRLGQLQLRRITPEKLQAFQADLADAGVGKETVRKSLAMLQGILERAVEWGRIPRNPAKHVRKPPQGRTRTVVPLSPRQIEQMRRQMLKKKWHRDAALVSVLAYGGLRPGEALALRWSDIGKQTILVDKALSLGQERTTKTGRKRSVRLLAPLAKDLAEWRIASGRPDESSLVFPTGAGKPWSDTDFRNWRRRRFGKAVEDAGLPAGVRPYDLRHSLASLLFAEQGNPAEVAAQMGHTLQTLFSTYVHVIEEYRGKRRVDAAEAIRAARGSKQVRARSADSRASAAVAAGGGSRTSTRR
jgi:integrase